MADFVFDPSRMTNPYYSRLTEDWIITPTLSGNHQVDFEVISGFDPLIAGSGTRIVPTGLRMGGIETLFSATNNTITGQMNGRGKGDQFILNAEGSVSVKSPDVTGIFTLDFLYAPTVQSISGNTTTYLVEDYSDEIKIAHINLAAGEKFFLRTDSSIYTEVASTASAMLNRGQVKILANGDVILYDSRAEASHVEYKVMDAAGALSGEYSANPDLYSASATVSPANAVPVAVADFIEIGPDQTITIDAKWLAKNDLDPDDNLQIVSFGTLPSIVTNNGNGTLTLHAPDAGPVRFSYTVSDGSLTSTGTVTIKPTAAPAGAATYTPVITSQPGTTHSTADHGSHVAAMKEHAGSKGLMPLAGEGINTNGDGQEEIVTPTHQAQKSGDWFDPLTWGGSPGEYSIIPTTGALIHIPALMNNAHVAVTYDFGSSAFAAYCAAKGITPKAFVAPDLFVVRIDGALDMKATNGALTNMSVDTIFATEGVGHDHGGGIIADSPSRFSIDADGPTDGAVNIAIKPFDIAANASTLPDYYSDHPRTTLDLYSSATHASGGKVTAAANVEALTTNDGRLVAYQRFDSNGDGDKVDSADVRFEIKSSGTTALNGAEVEAGWRWVTISDATSGAAGATYLNDVFRNSHPTLFLADSDGAGVLGRSVWDPQQLSLGIVTMGDVRVVGQEKIATIELTDGLALGAASFTVAASAITGWKTGDKIVVAGISAVTATQTSEDEIRTITLSVPNAAGKVTVTLNAALVHSHTVSDFADGTDVSLPVANMTRNITIGSAVAQNHGPIDSVRDDSDFNEGVGAHQLTQRGHIMIMDGDGAQFENVALVELGRTDKTVNVDENLTLNDLPIHASNGDNIYDPKVDTILGRDADEITNQRGRYALHLHKAGLDGEAAIISGNVVWGTPGWGIVQHSSKANLTDNIVFGAQGSAFVTETGNETGTWSGNLALYTKGLQGNAVIGGKANGDFGQEGIGFWLEGRGVAMVNNTSGSSQHAGYLFNQSSEMQVPIAAGDLFPEIAVIAHGAGSVLNANPPLIHFVDNEAFGTRIGLAIHADQRENSRKLNDAWSHLENFSAWNITKAGVHSEYTGKYIFDGFHLRGLNAQGSNTLGFHIETANADITVNGGQVYGFTHHVYVQNDLNSANAAVPMMVDATEWFATDSNNDGVLDRIVNYKGETLATASGTSLLPANINGLQNLYNFNFVGMKEGDNSFIDQTARPGVLVAKTLPSGQVIYSHTGGLAGDILTNFLPTVINGAVQWDDGVTIRDTVSQQTAPVSIQLLDDSKDGGLVGLWREDLKWKSSAHDMTNFVSWVNASGAHVGAGTAGAIPIYALANHTFGVNGDITYKTVAPTLNAFGTAFQYLQTIEREGHDWVRTNWLGAGQGGYGEFIKNVSNSLFMNLTADDWSGTILEYKKSDSLGVHYSQYDDFEPLNWANTKIAPSTNERIVFDTDMINGTLKRDGYFTMAGATYVDEQGVARDQKFVVMRTIFTDRLTGAYTVKSFALALDENWGESDNPSNDLAALNWATINHNGLLYLNMDGADIEMIVAGKYGHFRDGFLVNGTLNTVGANNYATDMANIVNVALMEVEHQDGLIKAGKGDDTIILTGSTVANTLGFVKGDGLDTVRGFNAANDRIVINGHVIYGAGAIPLESSIRLMGVGGNLVIAYGSTYSDKITLVGIAAPRDGVVSGTSGNDTINTSYSDPSDGDKINDLGQIIQAGAGNDSVYDGAGNDTVYGDAGTSLFYGGAGSDHYFGGASRDTISYARTTIGLTINLSDMSKSTGIAKGDAFTGVDWLQGTQLGDIITSGGNFARLSGADGNDRLIAMTNAELSGGTGADTFEFVQNGRIMDFENGSDKIDLTRWEVSSFSQLTILRNYTGAGAPKDSANVTFSGHTILVEQAWNDVGSLMDASDFVFARVDAII